ncbi:hypothetical protein KCU76_g35, partial [Aureobasidium melanogenum]
MSQDTMFSRCRERVKAIGLAALTGRNSHTKQIHALLQRLLIAALSSEMKAQIDTVQQIFARRRLFPPIFDHDIHLCLIQCQDIDDILKNAKSSLLHAGVVATVLAGLAIGGLTVAAVALEEWKHLAPE